MTFISYTRLERLKRKKKDGSEENVFDNLFVLAVKTRDITAVMRKSVTDLSPLNIKIRRFSCMDGTSYKLYEKVSRILQ